MKFRLLSALFFLILPPLCAEISGQTPSGWTLKECIDYAWENNLKVQQADVEVERNRNTLKKNKLAFIPNFNANTGYNLNWGRSVDLKDLTILENIFTQNVNMSLSASIYLLDGLSKHFSIKSGEKGLDVSIQNVEELKDEISIQITRAYLQVLLSEKLLQVAEENLESVSRQRDRSKILYEQGSKPYSTFLDMESQVASERVQVVTASGNVKKNMLALMQLLDLQYRPSFSISFPDTARLDLFVSGYHRSDVDALYESAGNLPKIKGAELSLEKSKIDLKAAKGKRYPTISMTASYGTYFSSTSKTPDGKPYPFYDQFNNNVNPSLAFGLTIPIFNGWSVGLKVKSAKLDVQKQELQLQLKHQDLYKEVQQAVLDADTYFEKMEAGKVNYEAMKQNMAYVDGKFAAGAINSVDYIVSLTKYSKAQLDYYQALYQFVFQLKIIDFYKGIPIEL